MLVRADSIVGFLVDKLDDRWSGDYRDGFNCAVKEQGSVKLTLNHDELTKAILDSMINESIRNKQKPYHDKGYKFSKFCSCGMCHIADLGASAIIAMEAELFTVVKE